VNENDATATDEISFGDNDALAAQVAILVRARLLVLLTSVEGVLDVEAAVIPDGAVARTAVFGPVGTAGKGGMESKVAAAELASAAGIPTVIASGTASLAEVVARGGTRFAPAATGESAFKLWLRYGKRVTGRVYVDEGAERAVRGSGASLLAVGVARCEGAIRAGDGVELCTLAGEPFGRGISSLDAAEIEARLPKAEAVHRDRLILY
jgi:glutamate 5-kinase